MSLKFDSRFSRQSILALLVYVAGAGVTSAAQVLIAYVIGSESYGIYAYALAWTASLGYVASLGFNISLLRLVPAYRAAGQPDRARGVVRFGASLAIGAAIVCAICGVTVILASGDIEGELQTTLLLGMAAVPLVTGGALGAALVRAFGGVVSAVLPERMVRDGLLLSLVALVFMSGWTLNASLVMSGTLIGSSIMVSVLLMIVLRMWPDEMRCASVPGVYRAWWIPIPSLTLMVGLEILMARFGVLLLGWTGNLSTTGVFALALSVAMLLELPRAAVNMMFAPIAADLYARGDLSALQRLFTHSTWLGVLGISLVGIPVFAMIEWMLTLLGRDYEGVAQIARILLLGAMATSLFGPAQSLLTMTGHERVAAGMLMFAAVVNVVGSTIGFVLAGAIGVAFGVAASRIIWSVAMSLTVRRRLSIVPFRLRNGMKGEGAWNGAVKPVSDVREGVGR
jgi:O-antigen/teichoic acid export membrane protein